MGVDLQFSSREAVKPNVEQAIRASLESRPRQQPWVLCEPPHFYPTDPDGKLRGGSKLNLHPHFDEVAEASKVPVNKNDLEELIGELCELSRNHGLTWDLTIEGQAIGFIQNGNCDKQVLVTVQTMADVAGELGKMDLNDLLGDLENLEE